MIRFLRLFLFLNFFLYAPSSALHAALPTPEKPNILFILADDLGWADTSLYGHTKLYQTPNIDRLAKRGMTFTRAYSASPLCSPTRSSILTGLSPARTGLTSPNCHLPKILLQATPGDKGNPGKKAVGPNGVTRLDTKYFTLAEALAEAGYAAGHFGKWHLGKEPYSPLEHGFDIDIPHWPGPGPAGSYVAPWKFPDFDPDTPDQHIEDRMAKEAVAFMEKHNADGPFFLNYWMFSVHAPFDAKRDLIDKYRPLVDPEDPQRSPTYAAMIESMDDAVGTLLNALDRLGIADDTIIIFFSDNGGNMYNEVDGTTPTSNAPLRGGKASMFEGGVRVPMIVSWPGKVEPGTSSDAIVQSSDFYPTILEMLGLEPKPDQEFDGISILPALEGAPLDREAIFTYFPHDPPVPDWVPPSVSIHHRNWKLIRLFHQGENGAHRHLLFNLADDLGEMKNLAAERPDLVKELDAMIEEFLIDTKAVRPLPNPNFDPARYRPELEGIRPPKAKMKAPPAKKADPSSPPKFLGWKARNCSPAFQKGHITIKGTGKGTEPFLGVGAGQFSGPAALTLRLRNQSGGDGRIGWIPKGGKEQSVSFTMKGGDWEAIPVRLPAEGSLGILRVYPPAQSEPVDIDWIELMPSMGKPRRWDFK